MKVYRFTALSQNIKELYLDLFLSWMLRSYSVLFKFQYIGGAVKYPDICKLFWFIYLDGAMEKICDLYDLKIYVTHRKK